MFLKNTYINFFKMNNNLVFLCYFSIDVQEYYYSYVILIPHDPATLIWNFLFAYELLIG